MQITVSVKYNSVYSEVVKENWKVYNNIPLVSLAVDTTLTSCLGNQIINKIRYGV